MAIKIKTEKPWQQAVLYSVIYCWRFAFEIISIFFFCHIKILLMHACWIQSPRSWLFSSMTVRSSQCDSAAQLTLIPEWVLWKYNRLLKLTKQFIKDPRCCSHPCSWERFCPSLSSVSTPDILNANEALHLFSSDRGDNFSGRLANMKQYRWHY